MTLSGLYTTSSNSAGAAREQLPLDGVHVAVRIVNLVAEVQVVQFFVNDRNTKIDCVYEFPMDDSAAVCGLEVELNDRLLIGEVREKNEAREEYSRAISQGQTAALVEEDKPDIFRQSIGNIPPQSRVNVRITYVTELKVDKETGGAIFVLPTSVAPRYTPYNSMPIAFATRWQDVCFGRRLSYSPGGLCTSVNSLPFAKWNYAVPTFIVDRERPTAFSLTLEAEMPSKVLRLESRTHRLNVESSASLPSENFTAASLFNEQEAMGKDLEITIYQEKPFEPSVQLEVLPDGSGCAMMTFVPEFETEATQMEIVFVVDCSGSMSGARIEAAKRAMGILVQSLPLSCTFNIVRFGSGFDSLFRQPQPYSQKSLENARKYIQNTAADMGGTEILDPLRSIVKSAVTMGGSRQVFVLTDGQVSNTEQVIQLLRLNAHNTRVFTVGIGDEVSRHLVEGMARASAGTAEFIVGKDLSGQHSGDLDSKLINQLKLATLPSITKIDVDWLTGAIQPTVPNVEGPTSNFFPTGPSGRHPGLMTGSGHSSAPNVSGHQVGSGQWLNAGSDASFAQPQGRNASLYQAPFLPPPLFSGYKYIMYCFFKPDEMARVSQVNVSALVPGGGDLFLAVPITKVASVGRTVHLLGARALVRDLIEGTSHLHFQKSFANVTQRTHRCFTYSPFSGWLIATSGTAPQDRATSWDLVPIDPPYEIVRREMIEIGTRFGIVSKETSFVAVERWSDGRRGDGGQPNPLRFEADLVQLQSARLASAPGIPQSTATATSAFFGGAVSQLSSSMPMFLGASAGSSNSSASGNYNQQSFRALLATPRANDRGCPSDDLCYKRRAKSAQLATKAARKSAPIATKAARKSAPIATKAARKSAPPVNVYVDKKEMKSTSEEEKKTKKCKEKRNEKDSDSSQKEMHKNECDDEDEDSMDVLSDQVEYESAVARALLHTVVAMQNFDGSINVNDSNAKTLGWPNAGTILSLETYKDVQNVIQNDDTLASKLFFAITFVAVLMQRYQSDSDKWSLVVNKTISWLTTTLMTKNNLSRSEANQIMEPWLAKTRKLCA